MNKKNSPIDALISELEFGLEILFNDDNKNIKKTEINTDQKLNNVLL